MKYRKEVPPVIGNPARVIADPKTRAYLYGIAVPVVALLVGLGVVADGTAGLILNVAAGVLAMSGLGLATANTDTKSGS